MFYRLSGSFVYSSLTRNWQFMPIFSEPQLKEYTIFYKMSTICQKMYGQKVQ